jgi:hypothetical protein
VNQTEAIVELAHLLRPEAPATMASIQSDARRLPG